jgi:hypothetical protein
MLMCMSNEMEEKPLPRASGCRNGTYIGGKNVGEKEKDSKKIESAQGHISHVIVGGQFNHKIG